MGLNRLTVSVFVIALLIIAILTVLISFYYILMELLTEKRKRVDKIFQRSKKIQKKSGESFTVIPLS